VRNCLGRFSHPEEPGSRGRFRLRANPKSACATRRQVDDTAEPKVERTTGGLQHDPVACAQTAEPEVERTRYAAALAKRQFNRVDLDNRLVAGDPEPRRECALTQVWAAGAALAAPRPVAPRPVAPPAMGKAPNSKVVAIYGRLPQIRADLATTDTHCKARRRCLVEKVVLDRRVRDIATARIEWRGFAVTDLDVKMRVNPVATLTRGGELRDRLFEPAQAGMPDDQIARVLTGEGHRSPNCADKVLPGTLKRIGLDAFQRDCKARRTTPRSRPAQRK